MSQEIKLDLSRKHSALDHRRVCAVIGCRKKETPYTAPFCWQHDKDPEVQKALEQASKPKRGGDPVDDWPKRALL